MPRITRLFIRTGLIWFLFSLATGLLSTLDLASLPVLMPLFWHMLTVGWITQIIMGVSIWMFPGRTREEGIRTQPRPWTAFLALNAGLVLRVGAEPFAAGPPDAAAGVILGLSGFLQLTGAAAYLLEIWPRVQSKEKRRRQRKKEREQRRAAKEQSSGRKNSAN
ncbi:MAG: hypothetical protein U5K31_13625 [Balneolaceae bacterium]|nr:hypothetical protein [Balneolaceae bacterium]